MSIKSTQYCIVLQCINGHVFSLVVERSTDVTESHITDDKQAKGFAVYRDRSLIECGYCKAYCQVLPGRAQVDVDFTPSKGE